MTTLPRLIGICGQARHGKDSVAGLLVEAGYTKIPLADNVKTLAYQINPIADASERLASIVDRVGWERAKSYPEVRRVLQTIGGGVRETVSPHAWIDALVRSVDLTTGRYVISDVRFKNEAAWVRRMWGEVWKVERPDFDNGLGDLALAASEVEVPEIFADLTILNDSTLEALESKVREYISGRIA